MNVQFNLPPKECPVCHVPFTPTNKQHVYCTQRCLLKAQRRRKRDRCGAPPVEGESPFALELHATFEQFLSLLQMMNTVGLDKPIRFLNKPYPDDFVWPPDSHFTPRPDNGTLILFPGFNSIIAQREAAKQAPPVALSPIPSIAERQRAWEAMTPAERLAQEEAEADAADALEDNL